MPKEKPIPPFPATGGEYELIDGVFQRINPAARPGCDVDLQATADVQGPEITTPPSEG